MTRIYERIGFYYRNSFITSISIRIYVYIIDIILQDMERPHSVAASLIESKSSVDGSETKVATHPRTQLESSTSNLNSSKPNDNLKNLKENNGILETLFKKPLQIINHFIHILHSNLAARFNA